MTKRILTWMLISLLLLSTVLTGCAQNQKTATIGTTEDRIDTPLSEEAVTSISSDETQDLVIVPSTFNADDLEGSLDVDIACKIFLSDGSTTIEGDGAHADDNIITISQAGTYIVTGTLTDGQLIVDASSDDIVQIVLDNAHITNPSGTAMLLDQAEKTIITLAHLSMNSVSDGQSYILNGEDDPDAAIYSRDDLTINGSGNLVVEGNYLHAIKSTDNLIVTDGILSITSAGDSLRGKDSVSISGGDILIVAGADGIKSNNDEDESMGWIAIDGGIIDIQSSDKGIQAESDLFISGGDFNITASGDALHSNGNIQIGDGIMLLGSDDDGIHADGSLNISGGTLTVMYSYEGLEGANVTILGGTIAITSSDDGINAAGGSDDTSLANDQFSPPIGTQDADNTAPLATDGARPQRPFDAAPEVETENTDDARPTDQFNTSDEYFIAVHGGYILVDSGGDGIDSNGTIEMTGGTLIIAAESTGPDPAIDCDMRSFTLTGGTLIASGSTEMMSLPTEATQPLITIISDSVMESDNTITLSDSEGNHLMSFSPLKDYQYMMISSPKLTLNNSYTINLGGTYTGDYVNGIIQANGSLSGDTTDITISLNEMLICLSPTGEIIDYTAQMPGGKGGGQRPGLPGADQEPPVKR